MALIDNEEAEASDDALGLATLLYERLAAKRKIFRRVRLSAWGKEFELLLEHFKPQELSTLIEWYVQHINDAYMPQAYSARAFVDKLPGIRRAFEHDQVEEDVLLVESKSEEPLLERLRRQGREVYLE